MRGPRRKIFYCGIFRRHLLDPHEAADVSKYTVSPSNHVLCFGDRSSPHGRDSDRSRACQQAVSGTYPAPAMSIHT